MSNKPVFLAFDEIKRDRNGDFRPCDAAVKQYRRNRRMGMAKDQDITDIPDPGTFLMLVRKMLQNLPDDQADELLAGLADIVDEYQTRRPPDRFTNGPKSAVDDRRARALYRPAQDAHPRSAIDIRDIAPGIDRIETWKMR